MKLKPKLIATLLFILTFSICIGILEIGVRIFKLSPIVYQLKTNYSKTAYRMSENPKLGYELTPNYRDNDNPNNHGSFAYINANGFRDTERSIQKIKGKKRILMVGDSIVAGHGIPDLNLTLSRQLEKILEPNTEVLNFGLGGYSTGGEIELIKAKGLAYKPDMIIIVFFPNDYASYNEQMSSYVFKHPEWVEKLFIKSSLFRLICLKLNLFHMRDQVDPDYSTNWHRTSLKHGLVEHALKDFKDLSIENSFETLIVVWPQFNENGLREGVHPIGDTPSEYLVEKHAKKWGLDIFRLAPFFIHDHQERCEKNKAKKPDLCENWNKFYTIGDTSHANVNGAETGARAIYQILKSKKYKTISY